MPRTPRPAKARPSRNDRPRGGGRPGGHGGGGGGGGGGNGADRRRDEPRVILDRASAVELLALLLDDDGDADEDTLEYAAEAIDSPVVPTRDQRAQRADGLIVTVAFPPAERDALIDLINDVEDIDEHLLSKAATRLSNALNA